MLVCALGAHGATSPEGPVAFGKSELMRSFAERHMKPFGISTEIVSGPAESYSIQPGKPARITASDERGMMYGLLAAAEQIRAEGKLSATNDSARVKMRGIRSFISNQDLEADWYYSHEYWDEYFRMLAYDHLNRFNLVFGSQNNYLVPPYPFWVNVPEFPEIQAPIPPTQRRRNLEMLQYISESAARHGVDFTLGIWEQNVWPTQIPTVKGVTEQNVGPYTQAALKKVLQLCPAIRSVQIRTNSESGIPSKQQLDFYGNYFFSAIRDAGHPVILDLRGWILAPGLLDAALKSGISVRMSAKYWGEFLGRPYQPPSTWHYYSYEDFLRKPMRYPFYWELWGSGNPRLLLWGNPEYVRRAVSTFGLGGAEGFEIDAPLATKGFGNRPGKWGIFTASQTQRIFWKWEFQRYWLFYMLWGRLSYDPKTPSSVWLDEMKKHFGDAAPDVMQAYEQASLVTPEIVAAHLADFNYYIWVETNPGGVIDDYIHVYPTDFRYIASIPEAVQNRLDGTVSAKQTPAQTSALLDSIASGIEAAVQRAGEKMRPGNKEWASSEMDFSVLSHLARYHARKMLAAYDLQYFYRTADEGSLTAARNQLERALGIWESLVKLTDGVYPAHMSFGPDDFGSWKDKLPYVKYDLDAVRERKEIFDQFGRFDFGFDFGGAVSPLDPGATSPERYMQYDRENNVEPRFTAVNPDSEYDAAKGFGWVTKGPRQAVAIPPAPYLEMLSVAVAPTHLPHNVLYGDSIRGEGTQYFRVDAPAGDYDVAVLHPDRTITHLQIQSQGHGLVVPFPNGNWMVSGLVIKRTDAAPAVARPPAPQPHQDHVAITHHTPASAEAGKPLILSVNIPAGAGIRAVRLYYRPLNQYADFKVIENPAGDGTFIIPGSDISPDWDLLYYFEVVGSSGDAWFFPDPLETTPYYCIQTHAAVAEEKQ
jgi:hypothetical protein